MDTTTMKNYASSTAPWRKNAPCWMVVAEGVILVAVGIYSLVAPVSARETIFAVFGLFLFGNGLMGALDAFRSEPSRRTTFQALRGGIGLSLGFLALFGRFSDYFGPEEARVILAIGYLLVAVISLVALFIARKEVKFPIGQLAFNLALLIMSIVFFTGDSSKTSRIEFMGWVAIVLGLLLLALGFYLRQRTASASADAVAPTSASGQSSSAAGISSSDDSPEATTMTPNTSSATNPQVDADLPGDADL